MHMEAANKELSPSVVEQAQNEVDIRGEKVPFQALQVQRKRLVVSTELQVKKDLRVMDAGSRHWVQSYIETE